MTDEQAEALGRRLVACDGFRWMPGMRAALAADGACAARLHDEQHEWPWEVGEGAPREWEWDRIVDDYSFDGAWPDLRDPATLGCVLALVRERWPDASAQRLLGHAVAPVWEVRTPMDPSLPGAYVCRSIYEADTEAEALVAALEVTP